MVEDIEAVYCPQGLTGNDVCENICIQSFDTAINNKEKEKY